MCATGLLERVGHGWYALRDSAPPRLARLRVLQDANPGVVACGATAAALWGLPVPLGHPVGDDTIEVAFRIGSGGLRGRRLGVIAHRWSIPDHHVARCPQGFVVTDPLRTALDLARGHTLPFALVPLDGGLRCAVDDGTSLPLARENLHQRWADARHSRGMRAAGFAHAFADPLAESPLESIVRGRIIEAQLPVPRLQVEVTGESGRRYRADMGLDLPGDPPGFHRLLIEADGLLKYQSAEDLADEKRRQHDLERKGHIFVRALYREAVHEPERFLAPIRRLLAAERASPRRAERSSP